jgi:hypothetical protein
MLESPAVNDRIVLSMECYGQFRIEIMHIGGTFVGGCIYGIHFLSTKFLQEGFGKPIAIRKNALYLTLVEIGTELGVIFFGVFSCG